MAVEVEAVTVQPAALAIWIAKLPHAELPPLIKTFWPSFIFPQRYNACHAVRPASPIPAASVADTEAGRRAVVFVSTIAYCDKAP